MLDLNKKRSEMETLARQLYRDHKKTLDLIKEHGTRSGFEPAAHGLLGGNIQAGNAVRFGNHEFIYSELTNSHISVLPMQWQQALGSKPCAQRTFSPCCH